MKNNSDEENEDAEDEILAIQNRRRRTKNNVESIIEEISKPKEEEPQMELQMAKLSLFGYYTYKLKKNWGEYVEKVNEPGKFVYLMYIYGLNLLHFISNKVERMEKKGEVEKCDDPEENLLGFQKRSRVRDRLRPMGEEGRAGDSTKEVTHRYKFRKSVKNWRRKKLFCKFCENSIKKNDDFLKCCSCESGFHKYCLEREGEAGDFAEGESWRCQDCLYKISTRRLTRNFKKQMNIDFI